MVKADERDRKVLGAAEKIGGLVSDGEGVDPQTALEALSSSDVDLRSVATPETARRAGLVLLSGLILDIESVSTVRDECANAPTGAAFTLPV